MITGTRISDDVTTTGVIRRGRTNDNYPDYGGSFDFRQTALNAGYNEGMKAGRDDRNHNRRFEFRDSSCLSERVKDYNSRMGDRGLHTRLTSEQAFPDLAIATVTEVTK